MAEHSQDKAIHQPVPTNIITGFLGTGKTTAILHLLKNKPENENWAVLVNEFGEIGIDGAIMSEHGAMIKEIPGGCMCCTAGVPMSVGINALLRTSPDRLLIEPTGLGHPQEIIAKLQAPQFAKYIDLKASIALIDPKHVQDPKYTEHPIFKGQIESSQIIIANKLDRADMQDLVELAIWFEDMKAEYEQTAKLNQIPTHQKLLYQVDQGKLELEWLDIEREDKASAQDDEHGHHHDHAALEPQFGLEPGQSYVRKENKGQGFYSCGWIFGAEFSFDFEKLFSMLSALTAERVKAVVNTTQGCYAFNVNQGVVSVNQMTLEGFESRFEVIDSQLMPWDQLEEILLELGGLK